jgi:polysaccharide export outer membrane protein
MPYCVNSARFVFAILVLLGGSLLSGQTFGSAIGQMAPATESPQQAMAGSVGSEPVAAGDLVYLSVAGAPELTRSYRISPDGQISLPMLKEGIEIAGFTPAQIVQAVTFKLKEKKILKAPIVVAEVMEYRSRLVSVVGSVKSPTMVQAVGNTKLLDAIARAQGLVPEAGPEIVVTRPVSGGSNKQTIRIPVKALFSGADPSLNIALHGGEVIEVPEAPKLYVLGNVKTPGVYPLTEQGGTTVMKALALSQGTLTFTASKAYVYRLKANSTDRQEITIDLAQILHRKSPDVPLEANDILYVPENGKMKLSATVLQSFSGFGASTLSGLIVWK